MNKHKTTRAFPKHTRYAHTRFYYFFNVNKNCLPGLRTNVRIIRISFAYAFKDGAIQWRIVVVVVVNQHLYFLKSAL